MTQSIDMKPYFRTECCIHLVRAFFFACAFFLAGAVLCVACHPFEASFAHAAMLEDTLTCFHDVYHATLKDKATATHCYEVNGW